MRKISANEIENLKEDVKYFVEDFKDNMIDSIERKEVIKQYIPTLFDIIPNYYNNNFRDLSPEMNSIMDIMSTSNFIKAFKSILDDEEFPDYPDWFDCIVQTLSIIVDCNHKVMSEETITTYTWEILRRMWKPEIAELKRDIGITEDLALELCIGIPKAPSKIESMDLDRYTRNFKNAIMEHSVITDNLDILGVYTLDKLFSYFFGKGSKTELNALGRILATKADTQDDIAKWGGPIYNEYIKLIYSKLNSYDISDIKYVLNFVISRNKVMIERNKDYQGIFDLEVSLGFSNITQTIASLVEKDSRVKMYL